MKRIFAIALAIFAGCCALAQGGKPFAPDSALLKLRSEYPQEKVFLQADRTYYLSGETIWMKAWCTLEGAPSYLSRILYVDLVNGSGEVIAKKMYRLDSMGSTAADIDIPSNAVTGNYTLNAYTLWMLNFPEYIYHRSIFVYNRDNFKQNDLPASAVTPVLKMQFFPEGGDIVAGVKGRVAFKIVDKGGFPVDAKGIITDNTGGGGIPFATEHDGMGVVEINAEAGKRYTAVITAQGARTLSFALPAPKEEGISLRVENISPARLFVLADRSEKNKARYNRLR
ncbi:MAG TPA: MG2 domain-containing protein, partial [Chitinophagaceae bacterium]|nr:MG2 domain-containing protein [Chitinophagaceae bacterium]